MGDVQEFINTLLAQKNAGLLGEISKLMADSAKNIKVLLGRNFHFFFPTVFLKNVKYRCKLREITMNRV